MSIKCAHNNVSRKYMERYANELECRFNRGMTPDTIVDKLLYRFPAMAD